MASLPKSLQHAGEAALVKLRLAPYFDVSTDDAEVNDNGLIYIVDRLGGGADILQLNGCAKQIVETGKVCNGPGD